MAIASWFLTSALCLLPSALSSDLTGTVRSLDGVPVSGATVIAGTGSGAATATTDADGRFRIAGITLPAPVEVRAQGFTPARQVVRESAVEFTLVPAAVAESVVVEANRPAAWRDPASGATVLSRADLDQVPAVTLDEAIRVISGFSLFRRTSARATNPTTQGVTMRGLSASGSSRALVLLDGVPLNDGFGGWVTWTRVPPAAVARVDVQRGAEGEAFGSDALGGVVRIVPPTGERLSIAARGEGGTPGVGAAELSSGGRRGDASLFGAASWFRTAGAIPVEPASRGAADTPTRTEWANGYGRASLADSGRRLTFAGWGGRESRNNGTVVQVNHMGGGTYSGAFDALGSGSTFGARVSVSPNRFYQTFSSVAASRATETLTAAQTTTSTASRAVVEYGVNVPRGRLLASSTFAHESATFEDKRPAATTTQVLRDDTAAVSLQAALAPLSRVTIGAGARHEWRAAPTKTDSYDEASVGRVSVAWHPGGPVHVRGSAASSHRWPTLNEMVRSFQAGAVVTQPNPDLRPERARSFDLDATVEGKRWQASAGGFHSVIADAIVNVTQGSNANLRKRTNAGEAHADGLELDGEVRPVPAFRLRTSVTIVRARLLHAVEPVLEGKRLAQVPRVSYSIAADTHLTRWFDASVVFHSVSSQFDDDRNVFALAPARSIDVRLAGRVGQAGWYAIVENAANARIEAGKTPLVTLAPPRSFRVGLTLTK